MSKKTFNVDELRVTINEILTKSSNQFGETKGIRQGQMNVLESILHQTGNYKGFRYLTSEEVPTDELPGIISYSITAKRDELFPEGKVDSTRVHYF